MFSTFAMQLIANNFLYLYILVAILLLNSYLWTSFLENVQLFFYVWCNCYVTQIFVSFKVVMNMFKLLSFYIHCIISLATDFFLSLMLFHFHFLESFLFFQQCVDLVRYCSNAKYKSCTENFIIIWKNTGLFTNTGWLINTGWSP